MMHSEWTADSTQKNKLLHGNSSSVCLCNSRKSVPLKSSCSHQKLSVFQK